LQIEDWSGVMKSISRRTAIALLAGAPAAAALVWTDVEARQAHEHAETARAQAATQAAPFKPKFFTAHEYATVAVLVDLIIPRDERSGSATDAGVPEFMDFMMIDQPRRQIAMRGGLAMVDRLATERFGKRFVSGTDRERRLLLDEIAYTSNPDRGLSQAIAFFSSFRDLTASGFWSTKMGVADLQYQGNVFVSEWTGCPDAALKKLGV
jgi:gluconate 2-dehydrogenase gamma chain